ncbi:MAG: LicD family protein [Lachnospiraceae bacterium]|nr:LicD family protein [Lachnospiraceae bacterium]
MMIAPNEYGTQDIQNELLDIMKTFHSFCEEHGIEYTLYGGSCLGAVRHRGFIPWDDDLDICVDRDNYNKLRRLFRKCRGLKMRKTIWIYRIQKRDGKPIRGYVPTLDVFVIDHAPSRPVLFKLKNLCLATLQGMLKEEVSYEGFSPVYKMFLFVTHMMGKPFSVKLLRYWYDRASAIGNGSPAEMVHCTNTSFKWIQNRYPADTWAGRTLVPFEDAQFYIPSGYDRYLTICYGDYMKLPEKEERRPEHAG